MSFMKRLLKRPFTSDALHAMAEQHLTKPPLPDAMYEAAATMVGKKGVSLLDHWRSTFSIQLDEIASQKTWQAQRAMLLRIVLVEEGWSDVFACTNDIPSLEVWAHLVSENETFKQFPKETWKGLLLQRYILAILSATCLMEIGIKNFKIDGVKQLETRLHSEYYREILNLDLKIGIVIREMIDGCNSEDTMNVARLKDDVINPIIADQYKVLALVAEQIANSKVDIETVKGKMSTLDAKKREIGKALAAAQSSAAQYG
ncbi:hypothetical protein [Aliirhizobium cellulosilyticum]|uniref:Uncharacterized protein n=1 Tax=Aliirhizobium cellulosilyticum TaxID=393664 RepID=A0A7W6Y2M9_9HYPH|nr:hypothetical protein [Rhizobium cellulosilyticum]MBB4349283.1 hypothetical protein [Rhizobium cellulosilyticum]MBB4412495.1 hypothetical protein [Rhizobium cellulosilyticum]MBB4447127.1 hypothetical protein [Rhizobium cellulosilyticum]